MIDIQQVKMLNLQLQDEDIDVFVGLMKKLMVASKQTGFKKPFDSIERSLIENISGKLGLIKPDEINLDNSNLNTVY